MAADNICVLMGCYKESLSSLLALDQKVPSISSHAGVLMGKLTTLCLASISVSKQESERIPRQKPQAFHNLTSDMADSHFCSILFVRSEPLGPTILDGKDYTRV